MLPPLGSSAEGDSVTWPRYSLAARAVPSGPAAAARETHLSPVTEGALTPATHTPATPTPTTPASPLPVSPQQPLQVHQAAQRSPEAGLQGLHRLAVQQRVQEDFISQWRGSTF